MNIRNIRYGIRQATDLVAGLLIAQRLAARDSWTRARLLEHQAASFRAMVRHAAAASPFYCGLYRRIDLGDDLDPARLPTTDKRTLMENLEAVGARL
jgi:hypothetical protein